MPPKAKTNTKGGKKKRADAGVSPLLQLRGNPPVQQTPREMLNALQTDNSAAAEALDAEALRSLGGDVTSALLDSLKTFSAQDQRFESMRSLIYGRLTHLSKRIVLDTDEWRETRLDERCRVVGEIQECFYDLQLVEHASQMPVLALAKTVFALNKKRSAPKLPSAKGKTPKKQKVDHALIRDVRRTERDIKSPSVSAKFAANGDDASNCQSGGDEPPVGSSTLKHGSAGGRRRYNRDKNSLAPTHSSSSSSGFLQAGFSSHVNGGGADCTNGASGEEKTSHQDPTSSLSATNHTASPETAGKNNSGDDCGGRKTPADSGPTATSADISFNHQRESGGNSSSSESLAEKAKEPVEECSSMSSPSRHSFEVALLPRRRAAALAAAVSVTETMNPQRSASPRKRAAAGNSNNHADDDSSADGGPSSSSLQPDEPTYCLCEQISFGDMICCDYPKCPIEWFHFACVNIKLKPKGKKWFCPQCRGDKPTVLKTSLHSRR